ncbi:MAG: DEAD/DEAH box helicase, partial [Leptospiraceae bacterium]|nr:DEAD/DEAH box helicase [Leptospiraceae bacterium]
MHPALEHFHPLIQNWFQNRVGQPTDAQCQTWPAVAAGVHVLLTAPTGSGKTLSAFLWALHQLITGTWQNGDLRVLYISPLKALNNDIRINLLQPLSELRQVFQDAGEPFPEIRVMTRSGDTPPSERQRIQRRPPEILITTPESLNIMLTTARNAAMFESVRTVILDEVHAVAGNKRGTHLITAVERLVPLAGEFQRLALSATVQPLELIAEYLGGYRLLNPGDPESDAYEPRPVRILRSGAHKEYAIEVRQPIDIDPHDPDSYWNELIKEIKQLISRNRSTLVFANSRRFTEKIARLLNEGEAHPIALAHHGSLSREIRLAVEQRLKAGELPAIVATSSLELGIDIGSVDLVVLIQTPQSVNSTLQRLGRAGHGVGQISRGIIYPTHAMDILDAAIMTRLALQRDIETVQPPRGALDVLAQIIVSMVCQALPGTIRTDEVYRQLRCSYSYHNLSRTQFDLVIGMLTGRYADRPIRELRPRLAHDRIRGTLQARRGAERLLYMAGGTIPDRGYFNLRLLANNARIGELDEEFVWERSIGETFSLGNHHWRILNITHNDVLVEAGNPAHAILPFWRAETLDRSFHFQEKLAVFLEQNQNRLSKPDFLNNLTEEYKVDRPTAETLITFLKAQKEATNRDLPHRHHLVIEHFMDALNRDDRKQVILHTLWGGRVNRPYSLALRAAWRKQFGYKLPVVADDNALLIILPH